MFNVVLDLIIMGSIHMLFDPIFLGFHAIENDLPGVNGGNATSETATLQDGACS